LPCRPIRFLAVPLVFCCCAAVAESPRCEGPSPTAAWLSATEFLPEGYARDGSTSYQRQLQEALDAASRSGKGLVFPPMVYLLDDPAGLTVPSGMTLSMYGAVFRLGKNISRDGQAFRAENVRDVQFLGGEVAGRRDAWPDSVNVAGIRVYHQAARLRIRDMFFHDLSSNGIGLLGDERTPIRDVWVSNTIVRNCCNVYVDYLEPHTGPAPGSQREDQGGIAFYYVENFLVHGCALEDSRSDGTHFFHCADGRFTDNQVVNNHMGGYFVEGCRAVLASGNLIRGNGSRGVTIERDSLDCTLVHNLVEHSGREGLWAPDVARCVVTDNLFRENGRKRHRDFDSEIKIETDGKFPTVTADIRVAGNQFYTAAGQGRAVWITSGVCRVLVENNLFRGPVRLIQADPWRTGNGSAVVRHNDGWKTEDAGLATLDGDGRTRVFRIPHGLDVADPDDASLGEHVGVQPSVTAASADAAGAFWAAADSRCIAVEFRTPPPPGRGNVKLHWSAAICYRGP
jgi:hypothetical protein